MASKKKTTAPAVRGKVERYETSEALFRAMRAWACKKLRVFDFGFGAGKRNVQWFRAAARSIAPPSFREQADAAKKAADALEQYVDTVAGTGYPKRTAAEIAEYLRREARLLDYHAAQNPPRAGRKAWGPRMALVQEVLGPMRRPRRKGDSDPRRWQSWNLHTRGERLSEGEMIDRGVAASVLAGLVKRGDCDSLISQAERGTRAFPTLVDGLEVERKRVRKVVEYLTQPPDHTE